MHKIKNLLRSENGVVLLGNVTASGIGLLTFMLLARSLGKSNFGLWALFISAVGLMDLMRTGLVRQGLVRAFNSTQSQEKQSEILAASGVLAAAITAITALIVFISGLAYDWSNWSLDLFFRYYPLLAVASLPMSLDTWISHAKGQYRRMNALRVAVNGLFFLAAIGSQLITIEFHLLLWCYIAVHGLISLFSIRQLTTLNWKWAGSDLLKEQLHFGKHSLATLAGSNLLKSADNLIIGAVLGTEAVAIFAIPMKVLDLMEIPLRGFVMTAYRKLTIEHHNQQLSHYQQILQTNIVRLTLLCTPLAAAILLVPDFIINVLGGSGYEESKNILLLLVIPLMLLPLDKFLGASFDSIGKPGVNATKVWLMVVINIVGDWLVLHYFQSLMGVALVTIINITMGIVFGVVQHPLIDLKSINLKRFIQKSIINLQSAKSGQ